MRECFCYGRWLTVICVTQLLLAPFGIQVSRAQDDAPIPIVDQPPFDRITLNEANRNAVIDVQLLDLPDRKVPQPFPASGSLKLRRLSDPSTLYEVAWADVAKIELYEQLVLQEADEFIAAGNLDKAFRNLAFLHENYSGLAGLKETTEAYLQQDAKVAFDKNEYDESLVILSALYELNPQRPGTARAVEGVSDRLINERLAARDFAGARTLLDSLEEQFPRLQLTNISAWRQKFATGAERQLDVARESMASGEYSAARQAVQRALAILPNAEGAKELLVELKRLSPQIVVGVSQPASAQHGEGLHTWSEERTGRLTDPTFVELVRVGSEGGEYACHWATISSDDSGMRMELKFHNMAWQVGVTPDAVVLQLLRMADPAADEYHADFANAFASAEIVDGQTLAINWRYAHVKPVALLQFHLAELPTVDIQQVAYTRSVDPESPDVAAYRLGSSSSNPAITEETIENGEVALAALSRGDLDVVDQVPPWLIEQARSLNGVAVSSYRMPTVHVLLCNYANRLLNRREFRRALCYGIDRSRLVSEVLAGKEGRRGFRTLSGPFLAGITVNDAIGYAYKQELQPLPYEPRLSVVLATTARTTLAKQALIEAGQKNPTIDELPEPEALILVHPTDAISRTMCALIKRQLDAVGIPIELKDETAGDTSHWDLRYAELCMWEPTVDARKLLGPDGLAGRCSPAMSLALRNLDRATNWSDARNRLQHVHQAAFDDLPVIPLWQTVNYLASRESLTGITREPVSLYQDVSGWQVSYGLAGNQP